VLLTRIRQTYRHEGGRAVILAALDAIRLSLSRDFRPMREYAERPGDTIPDGDFAGLLLAHKGNLVTKWAHYPAIYDAHLSRFRGTPVRFLEIGVGMGGSLDIWREYFGPEATIFGIDINPDCAQFDGVSGSVRIGSQADASFLYKVIDEMGGVDVVLDDGSHNSRHMRKTLATLFPRLSEGGVYMIEDMHCAYLPRFGGGYRWPWSFVSDMKAIIDDMHHWYHRRKPALLPYAMHCYDSVVVLDKRETARPVSVIRP
jgi:hypothetical protein